MPVACEIVQALQTFMVTRLGGVGVAAAVDHLDSDQVRLLAERLRHDYGHIDVLANDIRGGELLKGGPSQCEHPHLAA